MPNNLSASRMNQDNCFFHILELIMFLKIDFKSMMKDLFSCFCDEMLILISFNIQIM